MCNDGYKILIKIKFFVQLFIFILLAINIGICVIPIN